MCDDDVQGSNGTDNWADACTARSEGDSQLAVLP